MVWSGTGYTTLDDLESRLDRAVEEGEISEAEAMEEYEAAMAEELQERAEREFEEAEADGEEAQADAGLYF